MQKTVFTEQKTGADLLYSMKRIRCVEETIAARYPEGKMRCPTHLSIGQEGVAAGVCAALEADDAAFSSHRAHAHYVAKGGNLRSMMAEIYGKVSGCCHGKGGSMHLMDLEAGFLGSTAIVANSIPLAVGAALSFQMQRKNRVSVCFFGDAATEEGVFHEVLNFAVVRKLPVLFLCENNLYSVYSPLSVRQPPNRPIWKFAAAYGVQSKHGNGNDVEEVYHMTRGAVEHIRNGNGPYFLEFSTYRWREHCGPNFDNDIGYRTVEEYEQWKKLDPIAFQQKRLQERGVIDTTQLETMQAKITEEINDAFLFAEQAPWPEPSETFSHLFAN